MKRKIEFFMVILLLIGVIIGSQKLSSYVSSTQITNKADSKTVVIDAGHGGSDSGKVGVNKQLEKDINLSIAKKVKTMLEEKGYKVVLTRTADEGLYKSSDTNKKIADMKKRVAIINDLEPPLAISIHQNSYTQESVKGAQVFYYSHSKEGEMAAQVMQQALKKIDENNTRQAKANDTYYLLKKTKVPTIIVECGFLSNWEEAEKLETDEYQEKVAEAVCAGVVEYIN